MHDLKRAEGRMDAYSFLMILVLTIPHDTFMCYPERAISPIAESQTSLNCHVNYTIKIVMDKNLVKRRSCPLRYAEAGCTRSVSALETHVRKRWLSDDVFPSFPTLSNGVWDPTHAR